MTKYKQNDVTSGQMWRRAVGFYGGNEINGIPTIHFYEEDVIDLGDGNYIRQSCVNTWPDARIEYREETKNVSIDILDLNLNPTGNKITIEEIYNILNSLYVFSAKNRDAILEEIKSQDAFIKERLTQGPLDQPIMSKAVGGILLNQ